MLQSMEDGEACDARRAGTIETRVLSTTVVRTLPGYGVLRDALAAIFNWSPEFAAPTMIPLPVPRSSCAIGGTLSGCEPEYHHDRRTHRNWGTIHQVGFVNP